MLFFVALDTALDTYLGGSNMWTLTSVIVGYFVLVGLAAYFSTRDYNDRM